MFSNLSMNYYLITVYFSNSYFFNPPGLPDDGNAHRFHIPRAFILALTDPPFLFINYYRAPIAQLDRVPDYESVGRVFESPWARQKIKGLA